MTQRRSAALAAVCTLAFSAVAPVRAAEQSSLTLTLPASTEGADSEASQNAAAAQPTDVPASPARHARYLHRRPRRAAAPARAASLPSRGFVSRIGTPDAVAGRLGVVTADKAVISGGRDRDGRVLSLCPKGQYLAIGGENASQYAVLMIDHTIGYVAKSDVQLLDYQVVSDAPSAAAAGLAPSTPLGLRMAESAKVYLGVPYVWGGTTAEGIDCSGFVRAVYAASGIRLPRVAEDQATVGYDVPHNVAAGDWRTWTPGDRLYFACHHPRIDHTAMYLGNGYFIHASAGHGHQVAIDPVDNPYYSAHLVAVRRSPEIVAQTSAAGASVQTAAAPGADPEADQEH